LFAVAGYFKHAAYHLYRYQATFGGAPADVDSPELLKEFFSAQRLLRDTDLDLTAKTDSELEKLIHIVLEDRTAILPQGEKLETLALSSGFKGGRDLHRNLTDRMKEVRQDFLSFAKKMEGNEP